MIVTVTPNPSIDRTVTLGTTLTRGAVHRVTSATTEPGGKGVNVARALTLAGLETRIDDACDQPACRPRLRAHSLTLGDDGETPSATVSSSTVRGSLSRSP